MILEIIENILQTSKLPIKQRYYWFRGLFNRGHSCGNKIRYGVKSALKAKDAMEKKYQKKFDVYKCIWCGQYHIGGSENKKIKKRDRYEKNRGWTGIIRSRNWTKIVFSRIEVS